MTVFGGRRTHKRVMIQRKIRSFFLMHTKSMISCLIFEKVFQLWKTPYRQEHGVVYPLTPSDRRFLCPDLTRPRSLAGSWQAIMRTSSD